MPTPLPDQIVWREATFAELPGWERDTVAAALPALLRSCAVWRELDPAAPIGRSPALGTAGDWGELCAGAAAVPTGDDEAARALFERLLRPLAVSNREDPVGLFTGYYEPTLQGSRRRGGSFTVPLHLRPPELVSVELGRFRPDLAGKRIAGRVEDGALVPFHDRAAIEQGALAGRGLELVWVNDPVDAFFLHIQGSGRVELAEGGTLRVGYAGQNGFPYLAIGRELVARGAMTLEEVSMQSIAEWLRGHPQEAVEVMRRNASYVFFRELGEEGPLGAQGVVLTPGRSLAVDPLFHAYGTPLWLDTTYPPIGGHPPAAAPAASGEAGSPAATKGPADAPRPPSALAESPAPDAPAERPLRRLMVAQDTGGAIRGPVRGDVFFGPGDEAAALAGHMRQEGRLWVLVPRHLPAVEPATATPEAGAGEEAAEEGEEKGDG